MNPKRHVATLFAALLIPVVLAGAEANLFKNGDFRGRTPDPWDLEVRAGYGMPASMKMDEPGVLRVQLTAAANPHYVVLRQEVDIVPGKTYRVTGEVKPTGAQRVVRVSVNWIQKDGEWSDAGLAQRVKLGGEWSSFSATFTATERPRKGVAFFTLQVGGLDKDVLVRNLVLVEVADGAGE